jgi:hypothetical protein
MTDLRTALQDVKRELSGHGQVKMTHAEFIGEARSRSGERVQNALEIIRAALAQSDDGKQAALEVAQRHGGTDGDHHKAWVIDQMVRALTGDGYDQFVTDTCAGEEGPDSYFWGVGIAP